jgi:hypothetical protein
VRGFLFTQKFLGGNVRDRSNVDYLVGVLAEIPTWAVAKMGKKRMDAGINLLLSGLVLNLAVLNMDGVKRIYRNLRKLRPPSRDLETQRDVVAQVK